MGGQRPWGRRQLSPRPGRWKTCPGVGGSVVPGGQEEAVRSRKGPEALAFRGLHSPTDLLDVPRQKCECVIIIMSCHSLD